MVGQCLVLVLRGEPALLAATASRCWFRDGKRTAATAATAVAAATVASGPAEGGHRGTREGALGGADLSAALQGRNREKPARRRGSVAEWE